MSAPVATSHIAAAMILGISILCWASPGFVGVFALVPASTLTVHFYVWNIVTAGFTDTNPLVGAACAAVVGAGGMLVEKQCGEMEMAKYLVVSTAAASVGVFVIAFLALVAGTEGLFYMHYCGDVGLACCTLVALKQQCPDTGFGLLRAKWLPLAAISLLAAWEVVHPTHVATEVEIGEGKPTLPGSPLLIAVVATVFSWVYLRFFQQSATLTDKYGDASAAFAFKTFFPEVAQPVVGVACDAVFKLCHVVFCGFGQSIVDAEEEARRRAADEQVCALPPPPQLPRPPPNFLPRPPPMPYPVVSTPVAFPVVVPTISLPSPLSALFLSCLRCPLHSSSPVHRTRSDPLHRAALRWMCGGRLPSRPLPVAWSSLPQRRHRQRDLTALMWTYDETSCKEKVTKTATTTTFSPTQLGGAVKTEEPSPKAQD